MIKWIEQILDKIALNSAKSIEWSDPPLPPRPNVKIGTNPPAKSPSPGPPGSSNVLITLRFCRGCELGNTEFIELKSYKDFFYFYMENYDKGIIYDVELAR